jgi:hypothetical protein
MRPPMRQPTTSERLWVSMISRLRRDMAATCSLRYVGLRVPVVTKMQPQQAVSNEGVTAGPVGRADLEAAALPVADRRGARPLCGGRSASGQARPAVCQAAVRQAYLGTLLVAVPTVVPASVTALVTAGHVRSTEERVQQLVCASCLRLRNDRGGARTHDLRIKSTKLPEEYWGPSDSKQDTKRPSSLLRIPIVPIETNGLSTVEGSIFDLPLH